MVLMYYEKSYVSARCGLLVCFFFSSRRRHTRYWRDWSSDVCSSDLQLEILGSIHKPVDVALLYALDKLRDGLVLGTSVYPLRFSDFTTVIAHSFHPARDRKSVV